MATWKRLLLPAILLALAACKMSTNDLRPKTDEECAASNEKACGYRCVALDDPTTGCGNRGCFACSDVPARSFATCTDDYQCSWACEWGWADCNGLGEDGCEMSVGGNDSNNCGACGRICDFGAGCASGVCAPLIRYVDGGYEPRGILHHDGRVYWVDDGAGGEVMAWDGTLTGSQYQVAINLDTRASSPAVFRLAENDPAAQVLYATGALPDLTPGVYDLTLFTIDLMGTAAPIAIYSDPELFAGEMFQGLAVTGSAVFFAREGVVGPCYVSATATGCVSSGASEVRGLTASEPWVFFGYPDAGGTLSYADAAFTEQGRVQPLGSWPSRIAIHPTPVAGIVVWFWADERDGSVWAAYPSSSPRVVDPGTGTSTLMDIAADAWGVVWTDYSAGKIRAWRASDEAVFDLGVGGNPLGVALSTTHVYWTDSPSAAIYRVPKG
jgi:hypothetical protein